MKTIKLYHLTSALLIISFLVSSCKPTELILRSDPEYIHSRDSVIEKISRNYEIREIFAVYYSDADYVVQKTEQGNIIIDVKYYDNPLEVKIALIFISILISFFMIDLIK
ncbi:hypothetical protein LCGC14_0337590 [marine sediment metagenome]|uniref:Lipoprotein n=1 Tax=marine sediment metagenome TaxID=412755 RepID=A0A0F9TXQ3_9ZZZZ